MLSNLKHTSFFYQKSFIEFTRVSVAILLKLCRQGQCNKNFTVVTYHHFMISHFQNGLAYFSVGWHLIYIGGVYLKMTRETVNNIDSGCNYLCYLVQCDIDRDNISYLSCIAQSSQGKCCHCWCLMQIRSLRMTRETVNNINSGCTYLCYFVQCDIDRDSLSYLSRMAQGSWGKCCHCRCLMQFCSSKTDYETVNNIDSGCTCLCYLVQCDIYRDNTSYLCRMAQGSQGKCCHCRCLMQFHGHFCFAQCQC